MISDGRERTDGEVIQTDICIIGGGPAGIVLALELSTAGRDVPLLESGDIFPDDATQELYDGPDMGFPYTPLIEARLRFLWGSSNHWSGYSMPYTAFDFETRDWIPHSGWPIAFDDFARYYDRAHPYFELQTDRPYDFDYLAAQIGGEVLDLDPGLLRNQIAALSPPTAFGYTYEGRLRVSEILEVLLNSHVTELDTTDNAATVTEAKVACIDGPRFTVRARTFVLADGGIQVPRLLFNSNRVMTPGLGNANDLVGRFFNDHVGIRPIARTLASRAQIERLSLYADQHPFDLVGVQVVLAATDVHMRRERVPAFIFHFYESGGSPGKHAIRQLVGALRTGEAPPYLSSDVANLMTDLDGASNALASRVLGGDGDLIDNAWLGPWRTLKCVPKPDSRVVSVNQTDRFGYRRVGLDWHLTEQNRQTARHATDVVTRELSRLRIGPVLDLHKARRFREPHHSRLGHASQLHRANGRRSGHRRRRCRLQGLWRLGPLCQQLRRRSDQRLCQPDADHRGDVDPRGRSSKGSHPMATASGLDRRLFLGVSLAAASTATVHAAPTSSGAAARIGQRLIASGEIEPDATTLRHELRAGAAEVEALLTRDWRHHIREDFRVGRTVDAAGWVLSRTEACSAPWPPWTGARRDRRGYPHRCRGGRGDRASGLVRSGQPLDGRVADPALRRAAGRARLATVPRNMMHARSFELLSPDIRPRHDRWPSASRSKIAAGRRRSGL
ncbi:MAG: FAD-dependent monooxygenase [Pseudomonadota bacterium]